MAPAAWPPQHPLPVGLPRAARWRRGAASSAGSSAKIKSCLGGHHIRTSCRQRRASQCPQVADVSSGSPAAHTQASVCDRASCCNPAVHPGCPERVTGAFGVPSAFDECRWVNHGGVIDGERPVAQFGLRGFEVAEAVELPVNCDVAMFRSTRSGPPGLPSSPPLRTTAVLRCLAT